QPPAPSAHYTDPSSPKHCYYHQNPLILRQSTCFFFNHSPTPEIYPLSLHYALPIFINVLLNDVIPVPKSHTQRNLKAEPPQRMRSEEHTSELQSRSELVCRLLLEKKKDSRERGYAIQQARRPGTRAGLALRWPCRRIPLLAWRRPQ